MRSRLREQGSVRRNVRRALDFGVVVSAPMWTLPRRVDAGNRDAVIRSGCRRRKAAVECARDSAPGEQLRPAVSLEQVEHLGNGALAPDYANGGAFIAVAVRGGGQGFSWHWRCGQFVARTWAAAVRALACQQQVSGM
jgi:hypothetical protein